MSKLIDHDTGDWLDRWLGAFGTVYRIKATNPERPSRTWREDLASVMQRESDPGPIVAVHPDEANLDLPFSGEGPPILVWTATNVYFPVGCEDTELLEAAPRNPL
jgi:hypothetical protein